MGEKGMSTPTQLCKLTPAVMLQVYVSKAFYVDAEALKKAEDAKAAAKAAKLGERIALIRISRQFINVCFCLVST